MKTKITNQLLSVATALALLLTMTGLAVTASAAEYDTANATSFVFSDGGIAVTEGAYSGYKVKNTSLTINAAGTYVVSGSCANGTIVVKKNVTGVTLVLDSLTLSASATAPITCNKGSGVTIVAKAGSVNDLSDDRYNNDDVYSDETTYPDIENAVVKCKDGSNVTLSGTGTINVNAYGKNGVKGGADLYEEDENGNATTTLLSTASLTIEDVTLNVIIRHSYKDPEDASSYDGDAIKSEKELNILSGNITVSANDDGIKSDYVLNIGAEGTDGPTINVTKATEGMEGATVNVYSGSVYVNATDDGINAANGDIADRSADFAYNQYGGYVYINVTNGDGIDSNGSATLSGGKLEVYAPSQGDGDPIDTEYGCAFSGATVLAVGHAMMPQSYSGVYVAFGGSGGRPGFGGMGGNTGGNIVTAGNTVTITDASGNTLYTAQSQSPRNASYVVFASPSVASGTGYTLNGSATATATTATGGNMGPGGQGGFPGQGGEGISAGFGNILIWLRDLISRIVSFFQSFIQK
ncbi:MAG: carbohydrate-binding domain-containing protein [Clostridia bacterium]|nr:carbohydrate-binding domain-containing protein [Clostridia bacterium]